MVVRLGAVTGVGHARLIIERFGQVLGRFSVGDLFCSIFLPSLPSSSGSRCPCVTLGQPVRLGAGGRPRPGRHHPKRDFRGGSAPCSRSSRQRGAAPALAALPSALRLDRPRLRGAGHPGWRQLQRDPAHYCDRRHDRRTVAAVLPAVNVIDKRITPGFIGYEAPTQARRVCCGRRRSDLDRGVFAVRGNRPGGHFTDALGVANALGAKSRVLARYSRSCCWMPALSGRPRWTLSTATRSATCSASSTRCTQVP